MAGAKIEQGRKTKNKSARTHECCSFFFFSSGNGDRDFFPPLVPNVFLSCPQMVSQFSMSSHQVPKLFPNVLRRMFPIAPGFIPYGLPKVQFPWI